MSDAKLRELERRWRETRSAEDEAAWLRERIRSGSLLVERVELAGFCGHQAAVLAMGRTLRHHAWHEATDAEWKEWKRILRRVDRVWAVRIALEAARLAETRISIPPAVAGVLEQIDGYCRAPTREVGRL